MSNAPITGNRDDIQKALEAQGFEAMYGKGGFWLRRDGEFVGHVTTTKARKMTGVAAPKRERRERQPAWGEFATIAAVNRIKR